MSFPQNILLEKMRMLGYSEEELGGHCYGFSSMAVNAFLNGNIAQYQKRVTIISQLANEQITEIRQGRMDQVFTIDEENISAYEILAFFDGVTLYQRPDDYKQVFNQNNSISQRQNLAAPLVRPAESDSENKAAVLAETKWAIFDEEDFSFFIHFIQKNISTPFSIEVAANNHSISIHYDPNQGWLLIDPNNLPGINYNKGNSQKLGLDIFNAFDVGEENIYLATHFSFYTTNSNHQTFTRQFDDLEKKAKWQCIYEITADKATNLNGRNSNSPLHSAAKYDQYNLIGKLINAGADINSNNKKKSTPLLMAAMCGNIRSVMELVKHGADVNAKDEDGFTPISMAKALRYADIASFLEKISLISEMDKRDEIVTIATKLYDIEPVLFYEYFSKTSSVVLEDLHNCLAIAQQQDASLPQSAADIPQHPAIEVVAQEESLVSKAPEESDAFKSKEQMVTSQNQATDQDLAKRFKKYKESMQKVHQEEMPEDNKIIKRP